MKGHGFDIAYRGAWFVFWLWLSVINRGLWWPWTLLSAVMIGLNAFLLGRELSTAPTPALSVELEQDDESYAYRVTDAKGTTMCRHYGRVKS